MSPWEDGFEDHTERMERYLLEDLEQADREKKLAEATA